MLTLDRISSIEATRANGHIISSQQIKVAEYSQNGSVDTVTQAYTQAGIFANYAGLLYDMQA